MARIVTVQLLVDLDAEADIIAAVHDLLAPHTKDEQGILIDYRLKGEGSDGHLYTLPISAALEDAIVNETYRPGDAFPTSGMMLPTDMDYNLPPDVTGDAQRNCVDSIWIEVPPPEPNPDYPAGVTGNLSVYLKRTHEGVIVDIWPTGHEDGECFASTAAEFNDAAGYQEELQERSAEPARSI